MRGSERASTGNGDRVLQARVLPAPLRAPQSLTAQRSPPPAHRSGAAEAAAAPPPRSPPPLPPPAAAALTVPLPGLPPPFCALFTTGLSREPHCGRRGGRMRRGRWQRAPARERRPARAAEEAGQQLPAEGRLRGAYSDGAEQGLTAARKTGAVDLTDRRCLRTVRERWEQECSTASTFPKVHLSPC